MGAPDLGPDWLWVLMFVMGFLGLLGSIVGLCYGIYWLFQHVTIS